MNAKAMCGGSEEVLLRISGKGGRDGGPANAFPHLGPLPQLRSDTVRHLGPAEQVFAEILAGLRYEGEKAELHERKRENTP